MSIINPNLGRRNKNSDMAIISSPSSCSNVITSACLPSASSASSSLSSSTTKCSLLSLAVMSLCIWSAVMFTEPVQCRTMVKASAKPSEQSSMTVNTNEDQAKNKQQQHSTVITKRSINNNDHPAWMNSQARIKPLQACQQLISEALARSLVKGVDQTTTAIRDKLQNNPGDYFLSLNDQNYEGQEQDEEQEEEERDESHNNDDNSIGISQLLGQLSQKPLSFGEKQYGSSGSKSTNSYQPNAQQSQVNQTEQQNRTPTSDQLWIKVIKQCAEVMVTALKMHDQFKRDSDSKYRWLKWFPREKKSWESSTSADSSSKPSAESYAKKLDVYWKDLQGIRFKKQGKKIVRINGKSPEISNSGKVSKRMILLLLNVSVAKTLLEKFQSQKQLRKVEDLLEMQDTTDNAEASQSESESAPEVIDYQNHLRSSSSNQQPHLYRLFQAQSSSSSDIAGTELTEPQSRSFMNTMFNQEPETMITMNLTSPESSQSKLVQTKSPGLETPRLKKVLTKEIILRSDPWDKEGIRFKRSSMEESDSRLSDESRPSSEYLSSFDIFGQEGIRFKKSPFDDEGIRYKKSPFDDEGIRYKKTPFDDEGIRYKKSPFDDEGIRYKKSPFDNEGIRYKKSPFDDEHIRY